MGQGVHNGRVVCAHPYVSALYVLTFFIEAWLACSTIGIVYGFDHDDVYLSDINLVIGSPHRIFPFILNVCPFIEIIDNLVLIARGRGGADLNVGVLEFI